MARELHPGTAASLNKTNYGTEERTRLCQTEVDRIVAHAYRRLQVMKNARRPRHTSAHVLRPRTFGDQAELRALV